MGGGRRPFYLNEHAGIGIILIRKEFLISGFEAAFKRRVLPYFCF
jgi:hypothetical protein